MSRFPVPVTFHGLTLRARDPRMLARRLRRVLGWPTLSSGPREIVLGEGPELFLRIVPASKKESEGAAEIHLAVRKLGKTRRKTSEDLLGGDSASEASIAGLDLVLREFRRAPSGRWRGKRGKRGKRRKKSSSRPG